jgi:hypothetical protein
MPDLTGLFPRRRIWRFLGAAMMMPDNPYATPKSTGQAEELSAPVTMPMRWLFMVMFSLAAFLQIKMGVTVAMEGYFPGAEKHSDPLHAESARDLFPWIVVMGLVSLAEVWCLARRRWSWWVFVAALAGALFTLAL